MSVDTGFDYHVDIAVSCDGERPNAETLKVMRTNLEGVAARDRINLSRPSYKWFKIADDWIFVMGANAP